MGNELPVLYKMTSTGAIQQWSIEVGDDGVYPTYTVTHGQKDGKLQSTTTTVKQGKNIGKANETTPMTQCKSEALSLWTKQQKRKGYTAHIPTEKPKLPMLAKSFDKDGHKIVWPAMAQPKLDGIRCMAEIDLRGNVVLKSRQNKMFLSLGHIADAIKHYAPDLLGHTLDGELYNHQLKDDFQRLVSAIKRDKASAESSLIQYHIYDVFTDEDFEDRIDSLNKLCFGNRCGGVLQIVPTCEVKNKDEFYECYHDFVHGGYEGAMIRNFKGPYEQNRRSPNLQKFKSFKDMEFKIVGAYENKGKQEGQCTFTCITKDGAEFGVKPKGSDEQRRKYWTDFQAGLLTGKMMTVRFFEWTTSEPPVPRFPVGIAIRDYE